MYKSSKTFWALISILIAFSFPQKTLAESAFHQPVFSTASELISAVNSLRTSRGLPPYQINPILMSIAQAQADYLLSIQTITHTDANGLSPLQRALAAGYPVKSGYFSENIGAGGIDAAGVIDMWMGDAPHQLTMLSADLQDVGAGVATSGNTSYYVLDCGLSTGGTPVAFTPPPHLPQSTPTIIPNTPNPDGSIIHIVQPGDTLGSLSMAYNVALADILKLNGLTLKSIIYVGEKIKIQAAYTATPTQPTSTPTIPPTATLWPTSTATLTPSVTPLPSTPSPALPVSAAGGAVIAIVVSALVLAGLIALLGRKRNI